MWLFQFLLFWDGVGYKTVSVCLLQFLLFWDRVGYRTSPRPGHHLPGSETRECAAGQGRCVCHRLCTYATNWLGNPLQLRGKCRDHPHPTPTHQKKIHGQRSPPHDSVSWSSETPEERPCLFKALMDLELISKWADRSLSRKGNSSGTGSLNTMCVGGGGSFVF